ncbi:MAG: 3-dehydroquinate synthase [Clostridia bacterium]|nr:3-dehydroquinate synthase [Clostridia bacterium]
MKSVTVKASGIYEVLVGEGVLNDIGRYTAEVVRGRTVAVVSDSNVFPLYGERVCTALRTAGFRVETFVFPAGEEQKNLTTYGQLLHQLCAWELTRQDALVALGGGVVGDLTGFAAATYLRGIDFVNVPTSLLAMVDSSVGGKTAVDLDIGKNQVGCFYQPKRVVCDVMTLQTLPPEQMACGCAEVIKYGLMANRPFFERMGQQPMATWMEEVIATCVEMKRDVVEQDEFEHGCRVLLNLGHTVGHAIETVSGYQILHGQAIAVGMVVLTRAAIRRGICQPEVLPQLTALLQQYGLPVETAFSAEVLAKVIRSDKKRRGDTVSMVLPETIGRCRVESVPIAELTAWLHDGGIA